MKARVQVGAPNYYELKNQQAFWTHFTSENGSFLYVVTDRWRDSNPIVGFNITADEINNHDPFVPFYVYDESDVGLELISVHSYPYESRFCAVPGSGIVCFIANDTSGKPDNEIDLEVYAFDANVGGTAEVLSSDVTPGTVNSINQMYLSTNANCLVFQRCPWAGSESTYGSAASRRELLGDNDLCVVTNVLGVVNNGDTPNCFVLSAGASHGHSVAFVGDNPDPTVTPAAVYFSSADAGSNATWTQRTLKSAQLAPGATIVEEDSTESFYEIMGAGRKVNDDPTTGN
jgi:hypothetical protein